jgi:hypothetical protein
VEFDDRTAFYGKDIDSIARQLASFVERILGEGLEENAWYLIEAWREKWQGRFLPGGIRQLQIVIVPSRGLEL